MSGITANRLLPDRSRAPSGDSASPDMIAEIRGQRPPGVCHTVVVGDHPTRG